MENNNTEQALFVFQNLFFIKYDSKTNEIYAYSNNFYNKQCINKDKTNLYLSIINLDSIESKIIKTMKNDIVTKKHLKLLKEFCKNVDEYFKDFASYENNYLIKIFYKHKRKAQNRIKHIFHIDNNSNCFIETGLLNTIKASINDEASPYFTYFIDIANAQIKYLSENKKKVFLYGLYNLVEEEKMKMEIFELFIKGELTTKNLWKILK